MILVLFEILLQWSSPFHTHTHTHAHTQTHTNTHTYPNTHTQTHTNSDPHSVASLLVQQLLTHFSLTFLGRTPSTRRSSSLDQTPSTSEPPPVERTSLREFLCQDTTLLLLVAIQIVSKQVK